MDAFFDSVGAALVSVLLLPGVLPLLALAVLVLGLPRARRARRPIRYRFGVISTAAGLLGFSLLRPYARYIHARGADPEWFWLLIGLLVPCFLIGSGLSALSQANNTPRDDFWSSL